MEQPTSKEAGPPKQEAQLTRKDLEVRVDALTHARTTLDKEIKDLLKQRPTDENSAQLRDLRENLAGIKQTIESVYDRMNEEEQGVIVEPSLVEEANMSEAEAAQKQKKLIERSIDELDQAHDERVNLIAVHGLNILGRGEQPVSDQERAALMDKENREYEDQRKVFARKLTEANARYEKAAALIPTLPEEEAELEEETKPTEEQPRGSTRTEKGATEQPMAEVLRFPKERATPPKETGLEKLDEVNIELGKVQGERQAFRQLTRIDAKNPKFVLNKNTFPELAGSGFSINGWTYADLDPGSRKMQEHEERKRKLEEEGLKLDEELATSKGVLGWFKRRSLAKQIDDSAREYRVVHQEHQYLMMAQDTADKDTKKYDDRIKDLERQRRSLRGRPANDNAIPQEEAA